MLNEHTLDQPRGLRLDGMVHALADQATSTAATELNFEERLAMLVQREIEPTRASHGAARPPVSDRFDRRAVNRRLPALAAPSQERWVP